MNRMKLKPYPKYKDSGIQWIGKIPEGWEVNRLKFLLSSLESGSRETGGGSQLDEGVFSLGGEHINWDGTLNLENTKLISEEYYNSMNQGKLKINDILLVKDGATIGKTAIITKKEFDKMAVNEHVFLMRSNKRINPKLLYYLICSDSGFKQIKLTEVGSAQGGINQDFIAKAYFSITQDKQDQTTIAAFLDKKNAKVDSLIEKDKKLIALLKEKRTALINHAVTKGLDPNVKLKDSGIQWIGEIPEGWEVCRIKNKTDKITDGAHVSPELDNGTYPFISTVNVKNGKIDFINCLLTSGENYRLLKAQGCKPERGDILYSKDGTIGETVMVNEEKEFVVASSLIIIRHNVKLVKSNFLNYLFQSSIIFDRINSLVKGSALRRISLTNIKRVYGLFPPKTEQNAIASFLDSKTSKIDKTIQKIEEKIKLLEKYKKSLIHYVVTGKVDVRGVEA